MAIATELHLLLLKAVELLLFILIGATAIQPQPSITFVPEIIISL
jgi:hypothetical protein